MQQTYKWKITGPSRESWPEGISKSSATDRSDVTPDLNDAYRMQMKAKARGLDYIEITHMETGICWCILYYYILLDVIENCNMWISFEQTYG